jgi:HSP20 family protein
MDLTNWNPYGPFSEEFNKLFRGVPMKASDVIVPPVDIYMTETHVIVEISLPGVDQKNVDISVSDSNTLVVKGKIEKQSELDDENYYRKERKIGIFHRSVTLPVSIDGDNAQADYESGILKISLPKMPKKEAKQIKINSSKK